MQNSIPQNPDIVGVGGVFNYALVKSLAASNPDATALLVARGKNGATADERAAHFFDGKNADPAELALPENVQIVELADFLAKFRGRIGEVFLPVLPSNSLRSGLANVRENIGDRAFENCLIVSASKGMENSTLRLPHEIIEEILGIRDRVVVLLGGNLAVDVARLRPMMTEIAGEKTNLTRLKKLFAGSGLRFYESENKKILDIAGPVKNVHSLAAGIASFFGDSTAATVATRGFAEYERIAAKVGGRTENEIPRNSGAVSDYHLFNATRNYLAGLELILLLYSGKSVPNAIAETTHKKTIEGLASAIPLRDFAKKLDVEMPLVSAVAAILEGKISVRGAAASLLAEGRDAEF